MPVPSIVPPPCVPSALTDVACGAGHFELNVGSDTSQRYD